MMRFFKAESECGLLELYEDHNGFHYRRVFDGIDGRIVWRSNWRDIAEIPTDWEELL